MLLTFVVTTKAQQRANSSNTATQSPIVKTYQLNSKLLERQVPYTVVFPHAYQTDKNARFPVLFLLDGASGSHKKWTKTWKLTEYSALYRMIIVNPSDFSVGSYTDSEVKPNGKWESYFFLELIPEIDKNFRTIPNREARAIGGVSMGGYGALKFGVKHPDKFVFVASIAGGVNAAAWEDDLIYKSLKSELRAANDLYKLFGELPSEKISNLPFIYLDCGVEDDGFIQDNQRLAEILFKRKIPHEFRQLPGGHTNEFFIQQGPEVLRISERIFAKAGNITNNN